MKSKRKWMAGIGILILLAVICMAGIGSYQKYGVRDGNSGQSTEKGNDETGLGNDMIKSARAEQGEFVEEKEKEGKAAIEQKEEREGAVIEKEEPAIPTKMIPKDIYIMSGSIGKIRCYLENAEEYIWEYYDEKKREWDYVDRNKNIYLTGEEDGFNRNISTLVIRETEENDGLLVRCKAVTKGGEEEYKASVHMLSFQAEDVERIEAEESYKAEAGTYVSTLDVPVNIIKKDGSEEIVTGLDGLFFCIPKDISSDMERTDDGMTVETVTTTAFENEYCYVEAGKNEILLRYRGKVSVMDTKLILEGSDDEPPEAEVKLAAYEIGSIEEEREKNITAEIDGMDNYTPLTNLLYAFKPKGEKVEDHDFSPKSRWEVEVNENGVWTAYVKDEAGNIGSRDIEIITLDQKPPLIKSVSLKFGSGEWKKENVIVIEAEDKTDMQYCYICNELGVNSGWIEKSEYKVEENGVWEVRAKDAAGNESAVEIEVKNIDRQPPVIISIKVKENDI